MEVDLIYGGAAEVSDILALEAFGFKFVIEDGRITQVIQPRSRRQRHLQITKKWIQLCCQRRKEMRK